MAGLGRFAELAEDWRFLLRRDGLKAGLQEVGKDLLHLPYRHLQFVLLARSLADPLPEWKPKIALEIRPFTQADMLAARAMDRPSEGLQCERRLALGQQGLMAFHQGQPVGYAWGCAHMDAQVERILFPLQPGEVFCSDVFTVPAFRGQGVQTALTLERFQWFRSLGFCRALCTIERRNQPSLAVWQRKFGSAEIGSVDFLRFGPWYRVHVKGGQA